MNENAVAGKMTESRVVFFGLLLQCTVAVKKKLKSLSKKLIGEEDDTCFKAKTAKHCMGGSISILHCECHSYL